jgi:hypothetical protein
MMLVDMVVPSVAALDGHVSDCLRSRMRRRTGKLEGVDSFSFYGCSCNLKLLTWEIWGSRANLSEGWIRPCGNTSDDFALVTSAPVLAGEARHLKSLIVGLDVALKGPFPLVGESELARESEMARAIWCDFTPNFFARNIKN